MKTNRTLSFLLVLVFSMFAVPVVADEAWGFQNPEFLVGASFVNVDISSEQAGFKTSGEKPGVEISAHFDMFTGDYGNYAWGCGPEVSTTFGANQAVKFMGASLGKHDLDYLRFGGRCSLGFAGFPVRFHGTLGGQIMDMEDSFSVGGVPFEQTKDGGLAFAAKVGVEVPLDFIIEGMFLDVSAWRAENKARYEIPSMVGGPVIKAEADLGVSALISLPIARVLRTERARRLFDWNDE